MAAKAPVGIGEDFDVSRPWFWVWLARETAQGIGSDWLSPPIAANLRQVAFRLLREDLVPVPLLSQKCRADLGPNLDINNPFARRFHEGRVGESEPNNAIEPLEGLIHQDLYP